MIAGSAWTVDSGDMGLGGPGCAVELFVEGCAPARVSAEERGPTCTPHQITELIANICGVVLRQEENYIRNRNIKFENKSLHKL